MFLPKLQWNSKTRRMGQETDGGKTCWNFLLLSDLQGFSAAITQKCYQMLLAIVGPKKTLYLHKVSLSFKTGKRKCFPYKCFLLLQFMPTQFWNFITYLLSFFFAESLRVGRSLDARTNRKTWILRTESCSCVVIYWQQQLLVSAILSYPWALTPSFQQLVEEKHTLMSAHARLRFTHVSAYGFTHSVLHAGTEKLVFHLDTLYKAEMLA